MTFTLVKHLPVHVLFCAALSLAHVPASAASGNTSRSCPDSLDSALKPLPPGSKATVSAGRDGCMEVRIVSPDKSVKLLRIDALFPPSPVKVAPPVAEAPQEDSPIVSAQLGRLRLLAGSLGASLHVPTGIAVDRAGNVYLADTGTGLIRRIASDGSMTVLAGGNKRGPKDGTGAAALFASPAGIALGPQGDLYIADSHAHQVRKMSSAAEVSTVAGLGTAGYADGKRQRAQFSYPAAVAVDKRGTVYVADTGNHRIRRIAPDGAVDSVAGGRVAGFVDGKRGQARFNDPTAIATDTEGNLYVADIGNKAIRKIDRSGTVTTLVGPPAPAIGVVADKNAPVPRASIALPGLSALAVGADGRVYFMGVDNRIWIMARTGSTSFIDWDADVKRKQPGWRNGVTGMAVDPGGNVYLLDRADSSVRKITPEGEVRTLAASGRHAEVDATGEQARFRAIAGLASDRHGNVYAADHAGVRKITPGGAVTTFGNEEPLGTEVRVGYRPRIQRTTAVTVDTEGNIYLADENNAVHRITPDGQATTLAGGSRDYYYHEESLIGSPVWGDQDGHGPGARFNSPRGIVVDERRGLFVADYHNRRIRKVSFDGEVTTFAGRRGFTSYEDGPAHLAEFLGPADLALDASGNLYVADNNSVRKITPDGMVSTLAGGVRNISRTGGPAEVNVKQGYKDGPGATALFGTIEGIAVDAHGNVFVLDTKNRAIRKITPAGMVSSVAGADRWADTVVDKPDGSIGTATGLALLPSGQFAISTATGVVTTEKADY